MSEAAFAQIGVCRESLNHALTRGRDVARRVEAGEAIRSDDRDCLDFYIKVNRARGSLRQRLHERAIGIVDVSPAGAPVFDPEAESTNAMKILNLLDPELRAPAYDTQELEAIRHLEAAKRGDPPEIEETPDETRARLAREAAALGLTLTAPPTEEERRAEIAAYLRSRGLRAVPVGDADADGYDPATAGPRTGERT